MENSTKSVTDQLAYKYTDFIKDLAKIISNYFGKDIVYDTSITETGEPVRIMDMTRAYSYGYKPEVSFEQGLNETIKWFEGEYCGRDI